MLIKLALILICFGLALWFILAILQNAAKRDQEIKEELQRRKRKIDSIKKI